MSTFEIDAAVGPALFYVGTDGTVSRVDRLGPGTSLDVRESAILKALLSVAGKHAHADDPG